MPFLIETETNALTRFRRRLGSVDLGRWQKDPNSDGRAVSSVSGPVVQLIRSALYGSTVLLNGTRPALVEVNGRPVRTFRVLRDRDLIRAGSKDFQYVEIAVSSARPPKNCRCPVCQDHFDSKDHFVVCPWCHSIQHVECYCLSTVCATIGCSYPVLDSLRRLLKGIGTFEKLREIDPLVRGQRQCQAGEIRDTWPFAKKDWIARCPRCETAFHQTCWTRLQSCPGRGGTCRYPVGREVWSRLTISRSSCATAEAEGA